MKMKNMKGENFLMVVKEKNKLRAVLQVFIFTLFACIAVQYMNINKTYVAQNTVNFSALNMVSGNVGPEITNHDNKVLGYTPVDNRLETFISADTNNIGVSLDIYNSITGNSKDDAECQFYFMDAQTSGASKDCVQPQPQDEQGHTLNSKYIVTIVEKI